MWSSPLQLDDNKVFPRGRKSSLREKYTLVDNETQDMRRKTGLMMMMMRTVMKIDAHYMCENKTVISSEKQKVGALWTCSGA